MMRDADFEDIFLPYTDEPYEENETEEVSEAFDIWLNTMACG